jgi:hypothetical protein
MEFFKSSQPVAIAKIEARTVSGRSGQAATTAAKAGSSNSGPVALSVARGGRELPLAVASCRITIPSSCDTTPWLSEGLDALCRSLSPVDACSEKMEAAGIAPASREASETASTYTAGHLCVSLVWERVIQTTSGHDPRCLTGSEIGAVVSMHRITPAPRRKLMTGSYLRRKLHL